MPDPAPRFRRLSPEDRREQIVDAARRVFARTPYADVSTALIAQEAGVTRGLVHHYFGGKRELLIAVVASLRETITASVRTGLDLPPEEMTRVNAGTFLDTIEAGRELLAVVLGAVDTGADDEVAAEIDAAREAIVDRILLNHTGTTDHPGHVRLAVRGYLGLAESASREWLTHGRATREEVHDLLVRALVALMRDVVPEPPRR